MTHFILRGEGYLLLYNHSHITDEETEAQRMSSTAISLTPLYRFKYRLSR